MRQEKDATIRTFGMPVVNNHGGFGRWAFIEISDPWDAMKRREQKATGLQLSTLCRQLKLTASDGKSYMTVAVNTENAFRIIQSIPSPKAEPFKRWLAQVGYQRVQEIENPELAQQRMKELYQQKGYPADWIEKRVRSIAIRDELTDEWKQRGIKEQKDFAILTVEISKATFGLTPSQYKDLKPRREGQGNTISHRGTATQRHLALARGLVSNTTVIAVLK